MFTYTHDNMMWMSFAAFDYFFELFFFPGWMIVQQTSLLALKNKN